jgi:hypothetical protein
MRLELQYGQQIQKNNYTQILHGGSLPEIFNYLLLLLLSPLANAALNVLLSLTISTCVVSRCSFETPGYSAVLSNLSHSVG